ncbi:hypothetical protein ACTQ3M_02850 [Oscillospiraceae bacterium LCP25S3_E10]|nr:hypothetical protein [Ruminococcus sp.]MDD6447750.1 hypothetical protein [Ruminococcus sp.]MDY2857088.1 hypothetical protein [Oscillospiraceae bacterium]
MKKISKMCAVLVCMLMVVMLTSCSDTIDILNGLATNTTVDEAMADLSTINKCINEAHTMVANKDTTKYGTKVYEDGIGLEDIIDKCDIKDEAENKRIDGVIYKLYWDTSSHYPFWSTDGTDDIRNTNEGTNIQHSSSFEITGKTNVNKCV